MTESRETPSDTPLPKQDEVWRNVKAGDNWWRGFVMVLFVIIVEMLRIVVYALALVQWAYGLFTRRRLEPAVRFGASLGAYADQIVRYLSYASDTKPFPFSEWPKAESAGKDPEAEPARVATPPPAASSPPLGPLDSGPDLPPDLPKD
ncbi:MAG: DUF4389 domain-containing protein [Alphaproteobacteria bacterium]